MAAISAGVASPVFAPSGFDYDPGYGLRRNPNGSISCDFDPDDHLPALTEALRYWDPVTGSDGDDGSSIANAKRNLSGMIPSVSAGTTVEIVPYLVADTTIKTSQGWLGAQPGGNVIIRNTTGYRCRIVFASGTLPTWSAHASYADVYQATISAPLAMCDTSIDEQPTVIIPSGKWLKVDGIWRMGDGVTPTTINSVPSEYDVPTQVSSVEAVRDASGSAWHHTGGVLYAKAADLRNLIGSTTFLPITNGSNVRTGTANNQIIYLENIDIIGGTPVNCDNSSSVTGQKIVLNHCSLQAQGTGAAGLVTNSSIEVFAYRTGIYHNKLDGTNYHSKEADGTTLDTSPRFNEIECVFDGNGTTGSSGTSDQNSTAHDDAAGLRVNSIYLNGDDQTVTDINLSRSWDLGCFFGQAVKVASGKESFVLQNDARAWQDTCVYQAGSNTEASVATDAELFYRNMTAPPNAGVGPVTAY